jgi:hypothetical protein
MNKLFASIPWINVRKGVRDGLGWEQIDGGFN